MIVNVPSDKSVSKLDGIRTVRAKPFGADLSEIYTGAVLTIIDDDGTTKFLTEHVPVYKAHGVTATTAVVASRAQSITGTTTYGDPYEAMSFEQLRQLISEGFDVQNHTWSHDRAVFNYSYNGSVTDAQIEEQFRKSDELFRAEGIDCCLMVYPWGASNIQERAQKYARKYARFGVYISRNSGQNIVGTNPMSLNRQIFSHNGTNIADVKAAINTAVSHNAWVIVMTHAGTDDPDAASLDELLTYAETTGIRIENFTNAARLKAPVYYAGSEGNAFYVYPDGTMSLPAGVNITVSSAITEGGESPVKGGAIYSALDSKANKVGGGTAGNIVTLGQDGGLTDSGVPMNTGVVKTSAQSLSSNERRIARENIGFRETHTFVNDGIDLSEAFTPAQFTGALAGGDFSNIFVGDYWTVTLNGTYRDYGTPSGGQDYTERTLSNVPVKLEIGAIGQYRYRNQGELASGAHHVVFISRDCLPTLAKMGRLADSGVSDWNADSTYAWNYSALKRTLNDPDYGIIKLLKATDIGEYIYDDEGSRGGLFLPTEHEVFGSAFNASVGYDYGDEFPLQLPVFRDNYMRLLKKSDGGACTWLLSAPKTSDASKICAVSASGTPATIDYNADCGFPLCFLVLVSFGWTVQPVDTTVVCGFISGTLTAEAEAVSGTVSYQWYSSASSANTGGTLVSGATSSNFSIPTALTVGEHYYYCVATAGDRAIPSVAAKVTVNALTLTITEQPQDTECVVGYVSGGLTCTAAANVSTALSYQWYSNTTASNTGGTLISGANTHLFSIPVDSEVGDYYYYCVVTAGDETASSRAAAVSVAAEPAFSIVTQPSNEYGALNSTVTFTIEASGLGLSYRWQWYNGSSWADTGSTEASTTVEVITARNARRYRCIVSNSAGASITSSEARLYVSTVTIGSQPQSAQIDVGGTATMSVTATTNDNTSLSYQWYLNGAAIGDATGTSYTTPASLARGAYNYACVVENGTGASVTTNTATITVGSATYRQLGGMAATNNITPPSWFSVNLAAGTYDYKLDVGGASTSPTATAIIVKQASSGTDASGTTIVTKTCRECNGGASFTGTFTITSGMPYLYMKYTPFTAATFTATFSILEE